MSLELPSPQPNEILIILYQKPNARGTSTLIVSDDPTDPFFGGLTLETWLYNYNKGFRQSSSLCARDTPHRIPIFYASQFIYNDTNTPVPPGTTMWECQGKALTVRPLTKNEETVLKLEKILLSEYGFKSPTQDDLEEIKLMLGARIDLLMNDIQSSEE